MPSEHGNIILCISENNTFVFYNCFVVDIESMRKNISTPKIVNYTGPETPVPVYLCYAYCLLCLFPR